MHFYYFRHRVIRSREKVSLTAKKKNKHSEKERLRTHTRENLVLRASVLAWLGTRIYVRKDNKRCRRIVRAQRNERVFAKEFDPARVYWTCSAANKRFRLLLDFHGLFHQHIDWLSFENYNWIIKYFHILNTRPIGNNERTILISLIKKKKITKCLRISENTRSSRVLLLLLLGRAQKSFPSARKWNIYIYIQKINRPGEVERETVAVTIKRRENEEKWIIWKTSWQREMRLRVNNEEERDREEIISNQLARSRILIWTRNEIKKDKGLSILA